MIRKWYGKAGLLALGFACFISQALAAEETERQLRVKVNQEPVSEEMLIQIEEMRLEEENEEIVPKSLGSLYPDYSLKYLEDMGFMGSSLILSDGTVWITKPSDGKKVMHWPDRKCQEGLYPAEIYVTTNNNWIFGRDYNYRVVNSYTGESALANISNEPFRDAAFFIGDMDTRRGIIELYSLGGDYLVFHMSGWDKSIYSQWQLNHCIILGRNSRWNASTSPYLLININNVTNVRANLSR